MPKQNRVTPFGTLIATPERGTLYGNRGCLVGKNGNLTRNFNGIRWIICLLEFKNRRHPVMEPGLYTGLFFLDEATALAAGHRPCAECQRERFELFRRHWAEANPDEARSSKLLAPIMDSMLHAERIGPKKTVSSLKELPDGTFVTDDKSTAYIVHGNRLHLWAPGGYSPISTKVRFPIYLITPDSIARTLKVGYPAGVHASITQF